MLLLAVAIQLSTSDKIHNMIVITSVCFCLFFAVTSHFSFWMYVQNGLWYVNLGLLVVVLFDTHFIVCNVLLFHSNHCTIY